MVEPVLLDGPVLECCEPDCPDTLPVKVPVKLLPVRLLPVRLRLLTRPGVNCPPGA